MHGKREEAKWAECCLEINASTELFDHAANAKKDSAISNAGGRSAEGIGQSLYGFVMRFEFV